MKNLLSNLNPKFLELVRCIGLLAQAQGLPVYLVGGPVRDLMLGYPNIDLDIVVEGNSMLLAERFACWHRGALANGILLLRRQRCNWQTAR